MFKFKKWKCAGVIFAIKRESLIDKIIKNLFNIEVIKND